MPGRFSAERWHVLSPRLDQALDLAAEQRAAWLDALRAEDVTLAADLESLLERDHLLSRVGYLEGTAAPTAAGGSLAGHVLGAYTLRSLIGQGGMGSVWLADRSDGRFEGVAAVKLLNASLVGRDGEARFRREGSILARLRHPHIAHLIDAGVSPLGQPFLVLEHVDGQRIDAYCDAHGLTVAARTRLFLDVLAAIAHAHANLIVHRDLKPANVLVTDEGQVKLLDFGIAKLLERDDGSDESGALTLEGHAVLTPEYATPEQVTGGPVTTATDVYALGVLFYIILTGKHPSGARTSSPADMIRAIVEKEAPRMSDAIAAEGSPQAEGPATLRGTTPRRLQTLLRGDLDNIVTKALKKDAGERYASVDALADDLRRYLTNRPVKARRDSLPYRTAKFIHRNRTGVAAAAILGTLLAAAVVRERTLRARAEAEAHKAQAVEKYLVGVFAVADPYAPPDVKRGDVTARALLDYGAARIDSLTTGPDVQADLRGTLGDVYTNLGLFDSAAPLFQRSLDQLRTLHGPRHPAVAEAMDRLGTLRTVQGRVGEAEVLLREALAQRRTLLGNEHAATASSIDHLAALLQEQSDYPAAEPLFREALAIQRRLHGSDHEDVARSLNNLGALLVFRGRYDEAEPLVRDALAIVEQRLGKDHPLTADTLNTLGMVLRFQGRFDQAAAFNRRALSAQRKTLGNAHPNVAGSLNNLANTLLRIEGHAEEAESLLREALALNRQLFGETHLYVAENLRNLGEALRAQGDFDGAERVDRKALAMNRARYGKDHHRIALNLDAIGRTLYLKGDLAGAIAQFREATAMGERLLGANHRSPVFWSIALARALREDGELAEAEGLFRTAAGRLRTGDLGDRPWLIAAQVGLGRTLTDEGRPTEGLPLLERALEMSREWFGSTSWRTGEAGLALGTCLAASGQDALAQPILREATTTLQAHRRAQPRLALEADHAVARLNRTRHARHGD